MKSYQNVILALLGTALVGVTSAEARQPSEAEMYRVKELAYQMEIDTDETYVEAVQAARQEDERERDALQKLYILKESAAYFYDQVELSFQAPEHTVVAFERLNDDFIDARDQFLRLRAYDKYRELFETIEDTMGNLRFYYVSPEEYRNYPDYEVYPHYPGFHLFVHIYKPNVVVYYRHPYFWHLHVDYDKRFPHRVDYKYGYGRYDAHYSARADFSWHKKHLDRHDRRVDHKPAKVKKKHR